jgi:hypothetical protein
MAVANHFISKFLFQLFCTSCFLAKNYAADLFSKATISLTENQLKSIGGRSNVVVGVAGVSTIVTPARQLGVDFSVGRQTG